MKQIQTGRTVRQRQRNPPLHPNPSSRLNLNPNSKLNHYLNHSRRQLHHHLRAPQRHQVNHPTKMLPPKKLSAQEVNRPLCRRYPRVRPVHPAAQETLRQWFSGQGRRGPLQELCLRRAWNLRRRKPRRLF